VADMDDADCHGKGPSAERPDALVLQRDRLET
jgi:hypothetical protein